MRTIRAISPLQNETSTFPCGDTALTRAAKRLDREAGVEVQRLVDVLGKTNGYSFHSDILDAARAEAVAVRRQAPDGYRQAPRQGGGDDAMLREFGDAPHWLRQAHRDMCRERVGQTVERVLDGSRGVQGRSGGAQDCGLDSSISTL